MEDCFKAFLDDRLLLEELTCFVGGIETDEKLLRDDIEPLDIEQ